MCIYFALFVILLVSGWLGGCSGETCYAKKTSPCCCEIDSEHKKLDIDDVKRYVYM